MFRRTERTRLDRFLAALEIPALGLWLGALCGFAFLFAPAAFHMVHDTAAFAALTTVNLRALAVLGTACGTLAIFIALVRSRDAADRTNDLGRAFVVALALGFTAYDTFAIVPAMAAISDVHGPAYHALHQRSTFVYGGAVLCVLAALVLAAIREDR